MKFSSPSPKRRMKKNKSGFSKNGKGSYTPGSRNQTKIFSFAQELENIRVSATSVIQDGKDGINPGEDIPAAEKEKITRSKSRKVTYEKFSSQFEKSENLISNQLPLTRKVSTETESSPHKRPRHRKLKQKKDFQTIVFKDEDKPPLPSNSGGGEKSST